MRILLISALALVVAGEGITATPHKEISMTVRGTFDVKMHPQKPDGDAAGPFSRLLLDKKYHGDLDAAGRGQMLAYRSAVEGSAGYVAMELVTGTLSGRRGSFVLQHSATMNRGAHAPLTTVVVPDSGTDELTGLAGELDIILEGEQHVYEFRYTLPEA